MNLPTIILLRHGETEWNIEGRYQGQLNSNLTNLGKEQALNNAFKIEREICLNEPFKFFSSPLGRAKESTLIICEALGIESEKIIYEENLQEVNYGIFEGKTKFFCQTKLKQQFNDREANKWEYVVNGGESYEMVTQRLLIWLKSIENEKNIIVVAHEMINRALRGIYCKYAQEKILGLRQSNDVVIKLENSKEFIVE